MLAIGFCLFLVVAYCWAAIVYLRENRNGTGLGATTKAAHRAVDKALDRAFKAQRMKHFATLLALSQELDGTVFSLRMAVGNVASLLVEKLDFDTIRVLEEKLGHGLLPVESMSPTAINGAAGRLEFCLASCQTVSALIEVGAPEPFDRSPGNGDFVSLLARAKKQLSFLPFRMKEERRIIKDAEVDLLRAQQWMEAASLLIRRLPLEERFAGLHARR